MNPYLTRTTVRATDLDAWNAALERVRNEYAIHPRAACFNRQCDDCNTRRKGN